MDAFLEKESGYPVIRNLHHIWGWWGKSPFQAQMIQTYVNPLSLIT